jgi:hypothetical protein
MYRFAMIATVLSGSMVEACRAADGDETFKLSPEFYVWPNQMTLFRQRLIHEELRITKDDRVKVGQAERKILILRNKTETEMRKLQGDKLIAAYDSLLINLARQTDRELKAALKPAQYRRFNEIVLQMRGVRAFFDPDFQKALHLTKSQQRQLGEIQDEATVAARKLMYERRQKAGVKDESRKRRQDIDDRAAKRILRLLTSEQRKTYKSMLGKLLAPKPRTPSIVLTSTPHFGWVNSTELRGRLRDASAMRRK